MKKGAYSFMYIFLMLFTVPMSLFGADNRKSKKIDDMPLYKDGSEQPFGFMRKIPDNSNQSPICYDLLVSDKTKIARVHVHTIEPKHLWIKFVSDTTLNRKKVEELLLLWKDGPLKPEEMKREIDLLSSK